MTDNPETLYVFYNNEITAFQPNDRDFHIGNCEFQKDKEKIDYHKTYYNNSKTVRIE